MALQVESGAVRHNTQTFNRGRYAAIASLEDYEILKDRAKTIKEDAIARLPDLLRTLEESVRKSGGHFFLAKDGRAASSYIAEVCRARSEEHTSELQSHVNLVCRLLLEKKK